MSITDEQLYERWKHLQQIIRVGDRIEIWDGVIDVRYDGFVMRHMAGFMYSDSWMFKSNSYDIWIQPMNSLFEHDIDPIHARYKINDAWLSFDEVMALEVPL